MTNQALFLQDLAKLSGIPMRDKYGKKNFRVVTESKRVPVRDWETQKIKSYYVEYGDANLFSNNMPIGTCFEVADKMASAGATVTVYPTRDGLWARLTASTDTPYMERGTVTRYSTDYTWENALVYKVDFDADLHTAAWARANAR